MAATVDIVQMIEVLALAGGDEWRNIKFTSSTTPTETVQGKPIIANSAVTLDLGDIAAVAFGFKGITYPSPSFI